MDQVLIPTDFSQVSLNAIAYVLRFLDGRPSAIRLLNTYTPEFVNTRVLATASGHAEEDRMQKSSEDGLFRLVEHLQEEFPGFEYRATSSFNLLTEEIRERSAHADLIVSGTSRAEGLPDVFRGTTTARILSAATGCPVLVVPAGARFRKPEKIGLITDFSRPLTGKQLGLIELFACRFHSELEIVQADNPEMPVSLRELHRSQYFLKLGELYGCPRPISSTPPEAGLSQLHRLGFDMVILARSYDDLERKWLRQAGSDARVMWPPIPLLVLPGPLARLV